MLHLVQSTKGPGPRAPAQREDAAARHLAIVKRYEILDTPPEPAFDRITALASALFKAPISIISFLDRDRHWFKSHHGLDATQVSWGPGMAAPGIEPQILREFDCGFFVGVPLHTHDGHDLGTLCVIDRQPRQVDEQQIRHLHALAAIAMDQLELRLAARHAAAKAHVMASETDHRAMNSLQLVASLLHLQSRAVGGAEAAQQLSTAANRVLAVARVHRNFSADEGADRVPILAYLNRLCGELGDILAADIKVEGVEASIPTSQILAIGLIVNELATNAKKHGAGPIRITFRSDGSGHHELCVLDEGEGLPQGFTMEPKGSKTLGMKVVTVLVEQLEGTLSAHPNPAGRGACFKVAFPQQ